MYEKAEWVFWLSLSNEQHWDCLRLAKLNIKNAVKFAWEHYIV